MDMFNWSAFSKRREANEPTRDAFIATAFRQYVEGNDSFQDKSTAEMEDYFGTFKSAWILAEMVITGKK